MHDLMDLVDGYNRFSAAREEKKAKLYQQLATVGQSPKTMVISCCDSRVDPSTIFDAGPGELFIVRNVANLVPPFEPHGDYHGTSAAIEFAVLGLKVDSIVVMGHAQCGGITKFLDGRDEWSRSVGFIDRWMSLLNPARTHVLRSGGGQSNEQLQESMEFAGVRVSIENLQTFPFVKEAMANRNMKLRGAYFSIFHSSLMGLDMETGEFHPV